MVWDDDCGIVVMMYVDYFLRSWLCFFLVDFEKLKIFSGFVKDNVSKVIWDVLESKFSGKRYVVSECVVIMCEFVMIFCDRVVVFEMKKYKFICMCYII